MSERNLYNELSAPFAHEVIRTVRKSGTELSYIPISEIITRMNRVFGPTGWCYEVLSCGRDATDPDWVISHVRVTIVEATSREKWTVNHHDGFGGVKVKRTKQGDIVDLGDEFKGATSDALKKACQHFGVGLYLARTEEALQIEATEDQYEALKPILDLYAQFVNLRDQLPKDKVPEIRAFWAKYSGGRDVPKPNEFTEDELNALITETTRLLLDAEYVSDDK